MRSASDFDSFEDAWRQYLMALRKVWIKTERGCQHVRKRFEPWQGKFKRQRKKDQLLRYLKHARNADEHTIQLILDDVPEQIVTVDGDTVYVGEEAKLVDGREECSCLARAAVSDLRGIANPSYLSRFPSSALSRVAPYCAPGDVRVVSKARGPRVTGSLANLAHYHPHRPSC
jgi:hypothetical protein